MLAAQAPEVDLDTDLEEQEHHADVCEQLELLPVGDEAGRERRHGDTERQVADDGGKPEPTGEPTGRDRSQQQRAELEDRGCRLHGSDASGRGAVRSPSGRHRALDGADPPHARPQGARTR